MKIHTVRKYLAQLPTEPIRNLAAHYKILSDAVCKNLGVRPINGITLAVVGQDSAYAAMSVSAALKHSGVSSATIDFDVTRSPETAITVNGDALPAEVISRIMTVIRTVERSLTAKSEVEYARPCVYEVFLLGALCACSEMGISHVIIQVDIGHIPTAVASIIPQPKMIQCNEIFPEDAENIKLIARRGIEEIVSAPQQKESRRVLYNLCTELNCNHAVVARGEIETGTPGFKGIPFTYRNFSAVSGTQLQSMVALSATTLTTIRDLAKLRIKITDDDAYVALNGRKLDWRGEMISIKPYTLLCAFEHADVQAIDFVISDVRTIISERGRRVNIIIDADTAKNTPILERFENDGEIGTKIDKIVTVGENTSSTERHEHFTAFSAALDKFPYLRDVKHTEDLIMIVCGPKDFLEKHAPEIENIVRDDFTY
jgi:hypothetical protein